MLKKLIISVLLCSLLMTTTVFAKTEPTYNTPNTTSEDNDKKSECEVTADIHYAYYVSMPAALTLEPLDYVRDVKKWAEMSNKSESEVLTQANNEVGKYVCWYQVKAKTTGGGLGGKYIKVAPRINKESFLAYCLHIGIQNPQVENGDLDCVDNDDYYANVVFMQNEDTGTWNSSGATLQKRIYFGDIASEKVVKVGSEKWSSIDGVTFADLEDQGRYKGNFDFVYGLVDSTD